MVEQAMPAGSGGSSWAGCLRAAEAASEAKQWQPAAELWNALRTEFPDQFGYWLKAAEAHREACLFEDTERILAEALAKFPNELGIAIEYAALAAFRNDDTEALERWGHVRMAFPGAPEGFVGAAQFLLRAERLDEADAMLAAGLDRLPKSEAVWLEFVRLPMLQGNHSEAARRWHRFAKAMPDRKKEFSDARAELRQTIAVSSLGLDTTAAELNEWVPGIVISEDPIIVLTMAGPKFPVVEKTASYYGDRQVYFFIGLHHTILIDREHRGRICDRYQEIACQHPTFNITLLANDVAELQALRQLGIKSDLVSQNAFVDEKTFTILKIDRPFEAVYNARLEECKRHYLLRDIENIKLLMADATSDSVSVTKNLLPHAMISNEVRGDVRRLTPTEVAYELNTAKCGLCLSKVEGAVFASIEYLLCGLPVVTTENVGGRNWFFTEDCVTFCADTPAAVAEAVRGINARHISREFVRQTALERVRRERLHFFALVDNVFMQHGQEARRSESEFQGMFSDKFNYIGRQVREFLVP
jgi:tetratricopeptide (TPR) repeat protein